MELTRVRARDRETPGHPLFGAGDEAGAAGLSATVQSGPFSQHLSLPAGTTVGEIRRRFAVSLHIAAESVAQMDGDLVGDDTPVQAGMVLTFYPRAGEKGLR